MKKIIVISIIAALFQSCATIGFVEDVEIDGDTTWILFNDGGDLEPIIYNYKFDTLVPGDEIKVRKNKIIKKYN